MCTAPQEFHTGGRRVPGVVWEGVVGGDDEGWKEAEGGVILPH